MERDPKAKVMVDGGKHKWSGFKDLRLKYKEISLTEGDVFQVQKFSESYRRENFVQLKVSPESLTYKVFPLEGGSAKRAPDPIRWQVSGRTGRRC